MKDHLACYDNWRVAVVAVGAAVMRRMVEVLRVLCDMSFWRSFIAADMHEEVRMMHEHE